MTKTILSLCMGALGALWLAGTATGLQAQASLKVGDPAPDFTLSASDGKTYKLSDFKGQQAVVIAWFPKVFTGGCTAECKSMHENREALRAFKAAYFTASCDPVEGDKGIRKFAESLELDYPVLADPDQKVARAYGVVNDERKVPFRWTFYIAKDGKIAHIDKDVKTASHGGDVAAKLKELGVESR